LEESLRVSSVSVRIDAEDETETEASDDSVLKALMDLSRREAEERDQRLRQEEQELQQILALSLIEK
jgi:hypothetical protein